MSQQTAFPRRTPRKLSQRVTCSHTTCRCVLPSLRKNIHTHHRILIVYHIIETQAVGLAKNFSNDTCLQYTQAGFIVESISPSQAPNTGGAVVWISGKHFNVSSTAARCKFFMNRAGWTWGEATEQSYDPFPETRSRSRRSSCRPSASPSFSNVQAGGHARCAPIRAGVRSRDPIRPDGKSSSTVRS